MTPTCSRCGKTLHGNSKFCPSCGTAVSGFGQRLAVGQILHGAYRILRPLSKGGMGAIYLAEDLNAFNRLRVVKEMLDYFDVNDPQQVVNARQRFEDEARTLAHLRHAGIPDINAHFSERGRHYIVMEYVEGENLETLLAQPIKTDQILAYGIQVCEILTYLATCVPPVIHHDIKPANIVIDKASNRARLVDFGTAKARLTVQPGGQVGLQKSSIYGTAGYAPPEQYKGQSEPRSDVYALAATLYHLLTGDDPGQHPFQFSQLGQQPDVLKHSLGRGLETQASSRSTAIQFRQDLINARTELARPVIVTKSPAPPLRSSFILLGKYALAPTLRPQVVQLLTQQRNLSPLEAELGTWQMPPVYAKNLGDTESRTLENRLQAMGVSVQRVQTSQLLAWRATLTPAQRQTLITQGIFSIRSKYYPADDICHCHRCGHEWKTKARDVRTLPGLCSSCKWEWYPHRIFCCGICGHEFAHANLDTPASTLIAACPACQRTDWLPSRRAKFEISDYPPIITTLVQGEQTTQSVTLRLPKGVVIEGRAVPSHTWLTPTPALLNGTGKIDVRVDTTNLPLNQLHKGRIDILSNMGHAVIPVELRVEPAPRLIVGNTQLDFGLLDAQKPTALTLSVSNGGGQTLKGTVADIPPWLAVTPTTFSGNDVTLSLKIINGKLPTRGMYKHTLRIQSNGGTQPVDVLAVARPPTLQVMTPKLDFGYLSRYSLPKGELLFVNQGAEVLEGVLEADQPWVHVDPKRFQGNQTRVRVTVTPKDLPLHRVHGTAITIVSNGGTHTIPLTIRVSPHSRVMHTIRHRPGFQLAAGLSLSLLLLFFFSITRIAQTDSVAAVPPQPSLSVPVSTLPPPTVTPSSTPLLLAVEVPSLSAVFTATQIATLTATVEAVMTRAIPMIATAGVVSGTATQLVQPTRTPLNTPTSSSTLTQTETIVLTVAPTSRPTLSTATQTRTQTPTKTPTRTLTATATPTASALPTSTSGPLPTTTPSRNLAVICPDPRSVLRSPINNAVLRGIINIEGTAVHERFRYYKLEYAPGTNVQSGFAYLTGGDKPVEDGMLAVWHTTTLPNGVYTLRLMTVERNGNYPPPCQVTIRIQN